MAALPQIGTLYDRGGLRWELIFIFWNIVGLTFVAHHYVVHLTQHVPFLWEDAFWIFFGWYIWIPATPFIIGIAKRYPVERKNWGQRLLLHIGVGLVFSAIEVACYVPLQMAFQTWIKEVSFNPLYYYNVTFMRSVFFDLLFYLCMVAIVHAWAIERKFRARDVKLAQLETQLVEAQLRSLRMQLNPHFLFNTMHTISAIMDENVRVARRMMADLSDLLRLSLDQMRTPLVPLRQEVVFLERYLGIEQERLQERLHVAFDIDPACRDAQVPNLILQPLVENAIKHGIAPFAKGGEIIVRARCQAEVLTLQVLDDGPGLSGTVPQTQANIVNGRRRKQPVKHGGIGLQTTRERLQHLYGENSTFLLENRPEGGLVVTLTLPYCTAIMETVP